MIKVDKKIPVPPSRKFQYPWDSMSVGDSFFVPAGKFKTGIIGAQSAIIGAARRQGPKKFSTQRVVESGVEGVRCWRIE